jgi:hypothetical protein
MPAYTVRLAALAAVAACAIFLAQNALARGAYDGAWSVSISGTSGNCDGMTYQYDVRIANDVLGYNGGDASISGHVGANGDVSVRVLSGDSSAAGSGRLNGRSGRGKFRGRSSSGYCSGTWSATRTGG